MLEPGFVTLAQTLQEQAWVPVTALVVAIVSAFFTGLSVLFTYKRDQREKKRNIKSVEITSSIENKFVAIGEGIDTPYYRCTVTNTNVLSIQIRSVGLASSGDSGMEIPLERAPDQESRVLAQGASEVWEMPLRDLQEQLSGSSEIEVVAIVTDTVGDRYVQDKTKSLPIHLES